MRKFKPTVECACGRVRTGSPIRYDGPNQQPDLNDLFPVQIIPPEIAKLFDCPCGDGSMKNMKIDWTLVD